MPIELPSLQVDDVVAVIAPTRLVLINRDPGPDEAGVPLDWTIGLEVVDVGTDGVDLAATQVWINGALAFDGGVLPRYDGARAQVVQTMDTLRIVLDPAAPFESQTTIEVRVVSQTTGGVHALDQTYTFTAEDKTAPRVLAAQATGPTSVKIEFDEDIDIINVAGFSFTPLDAPAVSIAPADALADRNLVTVTLDTEMTPGARYRIKVSGVTDTSGNPTSSPYDSTVFKGFRPAHPLNRRFDLWSMLPTHNRRADVTGDLRRFIACLQEVTDLLLGEVDQLSDIFDLERAPERFLDLILRDLGNPFPFDLDVLGKRRLASVLEEMYRQKGTAVGVKNAVRFFLGLEVEILPFAADTLILGESELGTDWILGPSSRFARYAFNVQVDEPLTETQRKQLRAVVGYLKPAHTHFVDLLEPTPPITYDHWELGISELGWSSELH